MMNKKAQQIAIAKVCGWVLIHPGNRLCDTYFRRGEAVRFGNELPDYLNDLNAMYEAEKMLQHYGVFVDILAKIMHQPRNGILIVHATAAQRAEAFLRTLGLWKEDEIE